MESKVRNPWFFGCLYILTILVFAIIYALFPVSIKGINNFCDALYFSIVTITTLGFGDIYPEETIGKLLVCVESLFGIIFIGLFLNAKSQLQAQKIDDNEKKRSKQERKDNNKSKLRQHYLILNSIMERYLIEAYALTTPIDKRKFPMDIMHYQFLFSFNDISDLYKSSLLLYDPPYKPVVATFFDVQDKLYSELRKVISDVDISYWEELEAVIHRFLCICNEFAFKGSILSCAHTTVNNKATEIMSNLIKEYKGELKMQPSNAINQYISLYSMLTINTTIVQQMADEMKLICDVE